MSFTKEQLELRKKGLGASEAATVLGLNPYASPLDLWMVKKGLKVVEENPAMRLGTRLEPVVAEMYLEATESVLLPSKTLFYKNPILFATPDRIVRGMRKGVEIKTAGARMAEKWGEEGTDEIPQHYLIQCIICMAVTDFNEWDVAVLLGGQDFRIYTISRDIELENTIIENLLQWWERFMVNNEEPEIDSSPSCSEYLAKKYPKNFAPLKEATPDEEHLLQKLFEVRDALKSYEEKEEEIKNLLKNSIGDADGIHGSNWKATWKATKDTKIIDWERLARNLLTPLTFEDQQLVKDLYTIPVLGMRKFLFSQKKGE